ncbi:MAG: M20 family metallopeptidase [Planctomycetes bacterium]|nr:M20 family metallopeptidase [Planctomycetota bacterium]
MKNLLKKLIATAPTHENGELQTAQVLENYFHDHGISAALDRWDDNRANLVATIGPETPETPILVIGVHIDVVPASEEMWGCDPFEAIEKNGKIYGRGSCDMQGGICAAAAAIVEMAQSGIELNGRIIFAATAGEETDSCGVKRFIETYRDKISNPIGILIPEPTGLEILRAHRGILWLKIETEGKTAHGSMPHLGINAIEKMNAFLNRLKDYKILHKPHALLGNCSMSINRIAGGTGTNIVPDRCSVELDIRTLPGQGPDDIISNLRDICEELKKDDREFKADISIIRAVDAMETNENDPFLKAVCTATGIHETKAAGFTTDGPYFKKLNAPVLIFGPGDGTLCHKPNEYIKIAQMEKAKAYYKKLITEVLA